MMQAGHGRAHPGRTVLALCVGVGILLVALGAAAVAVPEAKPFILLGALAADAIGLVVIYTLQRRRHW